MAKSEKLVEASVDRAAETQTHEGDGRSPIGEATEIVSIQAGAVARGPSQEPRRPRAGTILGDYELISSLGAGAMGEVWLARDTLLQRDVAVKLQFARPGPATRARFESEARALARLRHPNIVTVHHAGEADGRPFLVMELVVGRSLGELPTPLAFEGALQVGISLARGLAAAHAAAVLHRDVKPANAMVGDDGTVKLLDFGLAKVDALRAVHEADVPFAPRHRETLSEGAPGREGDPPSERPREAADATRPGRVMGTPRYLAPERWRGEAATTRTDIYSLGVVLYELLAGEPPIEAATIRELRERVLAGAWIPLREKVVGLHGEFARVVERCMHREPTSRPSADELREALEALASDHATDLGGDPGGNPYRGLLAFGVEHHALFFGREADVRAVTEELRRSPIVTLLGPSGQGKSSVARAGVMAAVQRGELGSDVVAALVVPGESPCDALSAALAPLVGADADTLADRTREFPEALSQAVVQAGLQALLVIDQLEELFTVSRAAARTAFVDAVAVLVATGKVRVLFTLRADFAGHLDDVADLARLDLLRHAIVLPPLSPAGLHRAIVEPARRRGYAFDPVDTPQRFIAASEPGSLPLLEFVLAELWGERDDERRVLSGTALDARGGIEGALARHADVVLAQIGASARGEAQRILLELVTPEGTRRRRREEELEDPRATASAAEIAMRQKRTRATLAALVRGRLVVASHGDDAATYEISHEALVRHWPTLRGWITDDAEARTQLERLRRRAAEWSRIGERQEALLGARQLAELGPLIARAADAADAGGLPLRKQERDFLDASHHAVRSARRQAIALRVGVPLLLLFTVVTTLVVLRIRVDRARRALVASRLAVASDLLRRARGIEVARAREDAFARYDANDFDSGETKWLSARALAGEQHELFASASTILDRARAADIGDAAARDAAADLALGWLLAVERDHDENLRTELLNRLRFVDDGSRRAGLVESARVTLASAPEGAELTVHRVRVAGGKHSIDPEGLTFVARVPRRVEPGSYVAIARHLETAPTTYPFLVGRGEVASFEIPLRADPPAGGIYVPAGASLEGAADGEAMRGTLRSFPEHLVSVPGFFIARDETTFAEYLEFLAALPPNERADRRPRGSGVDLALGVDGSPSMITLGSSSARRGDFLCRPARSRLRCQDWLRMPVVGVSWDDGQAYVRWLAQSGRVPGARLCTEREWERAARGADGRLYPFGNVMEAGDSNTEETWQLAVAQMGPDAVGSYPVDVSPFGVRDLGGNVAEWVADSVDQRRAARIARGGVWVNGAAVGARSAFRMSNDGRRRDYIGIRWCVSDAFRP